MLKNQCRINISPQTYGLRKNTLSTHIPTKPISPNGLVRGRVDSLDRCEDQNWQASSAIPHGFRSRLLCDVATLGSAAPYAPPRPNIQSCRPKSKV